MQNLRLEVDRDTEMHSHTAPVSALNPVTATGDAEAHTEPVGSPQEGIYYKWASVKMTLKFHFLWSTLF